MNKNIINNLIITLSLLFIIFLITNNNIVLESVSLSISIWKNNLFPTLFPFIFISNILIEVNFIDKLGKILNKIININKEVLFILICSIFSGFPSGSKLTVNLLKKNTISKIDAERIITFTNYTNPLFVLGFINSLINNTKLSYLILISHILGGLIIGLLFYKNINTININNKENNNSFGTIFTNSIKDSLNTLFILLGIITIFSLITSSINIITNNLYIKTFISSVLEITQGIKNITSLNISKLLKIILIEATISFGGISVHMQVLSIISEVKIKYKPFFISRILHAIISSGLVFIFYNLIN